MTKLMEWLSVLCALAAIWTFLLTRQTMKDESDELVMSLTLYAPVILLLTFGLYAATVVLYRVFTFNNCEEAAKELQQQILDAKADLTKKGFNFSS